MDTSVECDGAHVSCEPVRPKKEKEKKHEWKHRSQLALPLSDVLFSYSRQRVVPDLANYVLYPSFLLFFSCFPRRSRSFSVFMTPRRGPKPKQAGKCAETRGMNPSRSLWERTHSAELGSFLTRGLTLTFAGGQ